MNIHCPSCHQLLATHDSMAGQTVACPHCSQAIQIPLATPVTPLAAPGPAAVTPLPPGPGPSGATRVSPLPPSPFPIATDRPTRRRSSSRRSTRRTTRYSTQAEKGDDSTNRLLGICGSLILFVGVFCPFFSIGRLTMDYFQDGAGDGVIVLILAVVSFICVLSGALKALWFTGIGSMGVLLFTVIHYQMKVSESRMLSAVISIDWGCPLLFVGAALVIAAAAKPMAPRQ